MFSAEGEMVEDEELSISPEIMLNLNHVYFSPVLKAMNCAKALSTSQEMTDQSLVESKVDFESLTLLPKSRMIT
ncbi:hypothetical protein V6N12_066590 [Hibiscus sabdariffa]|uniref:Uncharacterized protein n=1 Tax=Hibiscus sabdariffa TaxID=183260 RepID=A0ABR2CR89_9ROSI